MELQAAQDLTKQLMYAHGLTGWTFAFDHARHRFGHCRYRMQRITLSRRLTFLNSEADVRHVILHEIAHALVGTGHGHDKVWKRKAIELGCTGNRCYGSHVVQPPKKWRVTCPNGHAFYNHRRKRGIWACGRCGAYPLVYSLNQPDMASEVTNVGQSNTG